jgi:hypothetical protein
MFVVGGGRVFRTSNNGLSWTESPAGNEALNSIQFTSSQTGYVCGNSGVFGKSIDEGYNWDVVQLNEEIYEFRDLYFTNSLTGFLCGSDYINGVIYKTTDGGQNWFPLNTHCGNQLTAIYFTNQNTGYVAGSFGSILKTTTGGGQPIGIHTISNEVPKSFILQQNYPNPFNPVTKFKFALPPSPSGEGLGVRVIIYDILGREIATLVNEQLQPGVYEVEWDGTNYPSGVYFYRLTTNEYTQTRKMVLLK